MRFQNVQAMSVSVGKTYSKDHFMHIFLNNFQQNIYYTDSNPPGRVENRKIFTDLNSLSISSLQSDYLNIDNTEYSGRNNDRENIVQANALFL